MQAKNLHIIAFDVPWPPDYGGVIDIFFKIKYLHNEGIKIHLHCFEYGRGQNNELLKYCESVNYYQRKKKILNFFSFLPFIVCTRVSKQLFLNLKKDNYPILFEGLHTTYLINKQEFADRIKIVRTHNIEHEYYKNLVLGEKNFIKQIFYRTEARKLRNYEKILKFADLIAAISPSDFDYFNQKFNKTLLISAFHGNSEINLPDGNGSYILYHGNLSVPENSLAVKYLINKAFSKVNYKCIVAGKNPGKDLFITISQLPNIQIVANPSNSELIKLINEAHIHIIPTFQATGIKLKLLNVLFNGRHCIVNDIMINNTHLEPLVTIANNENEMITCINKLMNTDFDKESVLNNRKYLLNNYFSNEANAKKLIELIFK